MSVVFCDLESEQNPDNGRALDSNPRVGSYSTAAATISLDQAAASLNLNPSLIKIDVEGFEARVLRGALNLLSQAEPPALCFEWNPLTAGEVNSSLAEIAQILAGYHFYYVDDFEGAITPLDLKNPSSWFLSAVPQGQTEAAMFPEASIDTTFSGLNRAKIAWYNIEPVLQERSNSNNPLRGNLAELSKPETRQVLNREIFPQHSNDFGQGLLTTFDVAFYPKDKGPYNFDVSPSANSSGIGPDGRLLNPKSRWGGIMRNIDQIEFAKIFVDRQHVGSFAVIIEFLNQCMFEFFEDALNLHLGFDRGNAHGPARPLAYPVELGFGIDHDDHQRWLPRRPVDDLPCVRVEHAPA